MLEEINKNNILIEQLQSEIEQHIKTFDTMVDKIKDKIYRDNDYELKNLKYKENKIIDDYYYRELERDFYELGITDKDVIYLSILDMYKKKQEENNDEEED